MAHPRVRPPGAGVRAAFPGFIQPALATSITKPLLGDRWVHEVKFDGYRVQLHIVNDAIRIFTRRGHDWTNRFKKIAHDAWHLNVKSAIIDGELIVPAADGISDFAVLQREPSLQTAGTRFAPTAAGEMTSRSRGTRHRSV